MTTIREFYADRGTEPQLGDRLMDESLRNGTLVTDVEGEWVTLGKIEFWPDDNVDWTKLLRNGVEVPVVKKKMTVPEFVKKFSDVLVFSDLFIFRKPDGEAAYTTCELRVIGIADWFGCEPIAILRPKFDAKALAAQATPGTVNIYASVFFEVIARAE